LPALSLVYFYLQRSKVDWTIKKTSKDFLLFLLIIVIGINVVYYFNRSFIPFGDYVFESISLRNLQQTFSFLYWLPVPFPYGYVQSIDMIKAHAEIGAGTPFSTLNGVYLFGELRQKSGFWYYYIVLFFYKMPIGTMLLFVACVPLLLKKFNVRAFTRQYMFLLIPAAFYFIILSFFNKFQIGIRHLLLIYPLMFVGLGYLFLQISKARFAVKALAAGAVVYTFISVALYYPFIIAYTNEFVGDKKMVFTKFIDSSIDYGQSDSSIAKFVANNAGYKLASPVADTGKYAVVMAQAVNNYLRNNNPYNWYQKLKPKGLYRYVILLYDIKEEDLIKAGLRQQKK
jgi:hypothetical protein